MLRLLAACSLCLATALPPAANAAERSTYSRFDREGLPIASSWMATERFTALTLASGDTLTIVEGDHWRIRADGKPTVLAKLRFLVEDGQMVIGRRSGRAQDRAGNARIEVTVPSLDSVTLAGSGHIRIDRISGPAATLTVAGSGTLTLTDLETDRLAATIAGSGELILAGHAQTAKITIAGSGDIRAARLSTRDAAVTVAGSGDAQFLASGAVEASIVGSGDVDVIGTRDCTQTRMGSGRLTCTL